MFNLDSDSEQPVRLYGTLNETIHNAMPSASVRLSIRAPVGSALARFFPVARKRFWSAGGQKHVNFHGYTAFSPNYPAKCRL